TNASLLTGARMQGAYPCQSVGGWGNGTAHVKPAIPSGVPTTTQPSVNNFTSVSKFRGGNAPATAMSLRPIRHGLYTSTCAADHVPSGCGRHRGPVHRCPMLPRQPAAH